MIALIAKLPIREDKMDEAIRMIEALMEEVAKEKGTLAYSINREKIDPNTIVFIERYRDEAALKHHGATPYFKNFSSAIAPLLTGKPELIYLDEIHSI